MFASKKNLFRLASGHHQLGCLASGQVFVVVVVVVVAAAAAPVIVVVVVVVFQMSLFSYRTQLEVLTRLEDRGDSRDGEA